MIKLPPFTKLLNYLQTQSTPSIALNMFTTIIAKADSGASKHFFRYQDRHVLQNITPCLGPPVGLPDGTVIRASHSGTLPLRHLSAPAKTVQIFKGLKSASLISVGQLCDDGCEVVLEEHKVNIIKNN